MAKTFSSSKYLTKVANIVAPISMLDDYSVSLSTQNFMSCGDRCTSLDVNIHYHNRNEGDKVISVFSTGFGSWTEDENKKNMKELKKFVNALLTQYYEVINNSNV